MANMLAPASIAGSSNLGFYQSTQSNIHLGDWRGYIIQKITPSYYSQLGTKQDSGLYDNFSLKERSLTRLESFSYNVFNKAFADLSYGFGSLNFTFESNKSDDSEYEFKHRYSRSISVQTKRYIKDDILDESSITPSYVYTRNGSAFSVGAVFIQQRYADETFGSQTLLSSTNQSLFNEKSFIKTSRGTGYNFKYSQVLPFNLLLGFNYSSRINMTENDAFGRSYKDSGDFDIPRKLSLSINYDISAQSSINLSSTEIAYKDVKPYLAFGYSNALNEAFRSPISPVFILDDLVVYNASFRQDIGDGFTWNLNLISRQQAPATKEFYDRILRDETASISYRLGISKSLTKFGEINIFTSYANKPIVIGRTDFGRISSTGISRHIEGVASWNYSF